VVAALARPKKRAIPGGRTKTMTDETSTPGRGILLRIEMVQMRMRAWRLATGDPGHIDITDPANLDAADPRYVRADHPAVPAYFDRIRVEGETPGEPDDIDELRRRLGL